MELSDLDRILKGLFAAKDNDSGPHWHCVPHEVVGVVPVGHSALIIYRRPNGALVQETLNGEGPYYATQAECQSYCDRRNKEELEAAA